MLSVAVFNMRGEERGRLEIDPAVLGGVVRPRLIKQAIVAYLDRQRQDSARTKGRGDVEGSTRKLYRQKGTGNARAGNIRTPLRRGGGRTFAKRIPGRRLELPRKMRRLARNSALLAKIQSDEVVVIEDLAFTEPKTKPLHVMLQSVGADNGCLLTLDEYDRNVLLSGRNLPRTEIRVLDDLSAYDVLRRKKVLMTKPAFTRLAQGARA
jgi:large subunit ribosomal protein L4